MEGLRKQLRKYQLKEAKQFDRELIFKQKVKNMFAWLYLWYFMIIIEKIKLCIESSFLFDL